MDVTAQFHSDAVARALKEARLGEALDLLQNKIRADASSPQLRLSLLQLLCVLGQWERARTQLQVLDSFGTQDKAWLNVLGQSLMGEALRRDVFAGKTTPLVLGEPSAWVAKLIQALRGEAAAQAALRAEAFDAAPAVAAKVNGADVPWLADADSRLGPVLEVIMDGKYYWAPFERIERLSVAAPTDLRHLVWIPAQAKWTAGGETPVMIPTRYIGTESSSDDRLRLARLTTWDEIAENQFRGLGQRLLTAGDTDFPLLEVRTIEFVRA